LDERMRCRIERTGNSNLCNKLGNVRPDHVRAENLAIFGINDQLDEPFGFSNPPCLSAGGEWEFPDLDVVACLASVLLSQTNACNLWLAVRTARNIAIIERMNLKTCDCLDAENAFSGCFVRKPRRTCNVPDCIDTFDVRSHQRIHLDPTALDGNAQLFET